jgi:hypothetical protein
VGQWQAANVLLPVLKGLKTKVKIIVSHPLNICVWFLLLQKATVLKG